MHSARVGVSCGVRTTPGQYHPRLVQYTGVQVTSADNGQHLPRSLEIWSTGLSRHRARGRFLHQGPSDGWSVTAAPSTSRCLSSSWATTSSSCRSPRRRQRSCGCWRQSVWDSGCAGSCDATRPQSPSRWRFSSPGPSSRWASDPASFPRTSCWHCWFTTWRPPADGRFPFPARHSSAPGSSGPSSL